MLFTLIFVSLFVAAWLVCGFIPWLALSIVTRGNAGMASLPLALFAGVIGGLAVPILIRNDGAGIVISLVCATVASAGMLGARRFAAPVFGDETEPGPADEPRGEHSP